MEIIDIITNLFNGIDLFYKGVLLIFMLLYSIFALMLYIQVNSLTNIVNQIKFSPILKIVAMFNIIASVVLIIYTILTI